MAPLYVGIDIGTTNITITALDLAARKVPPPFLAQPEGTEQ